MLLRRDNSRTNKNVFLIIYRWSTRSVVTTGRCVTVIHTRRTTYSRTASLPLLAHRGIPRRVTNVRLHTTIVLLSNIANDVYATVHNFQSCTRNRRTMRKRRRLCLFPPARPLEFCCYRHPRPTSKDGNRQPIQRDNDRYVLKAH